MIVESIPMAKVLTRSRHRPHNNNVVKRIPLKLDTLNVQRMTVPTGSTIFSLLADEGEIKVFIQYSRLVNTRESLFLMLMEASKPEKSYPPDYWQPQPVGTVRFERKLYHVIKVHPHER